MKKLSRVQSMHTPLTINHYLIYVDMKNIKLGMIAYCMSYAVVSLSHAYDFQYLHCNQNILSPWAITGNGATQHAASTLF